MGTDPYDGLNARASTALLRGSPTGRRDPDAGRSGARRSISGRCWEFRRAEARPGSPNVVSAYALRRGRSTKLRAALDVARGPPLLAASTSLAGATTSTSRRASSSIRAARRTRSRRRSPGSRSSTRSSEPATTRCSSAPARRRVLPPPRAATPPRGRVLRLPRRRPHADPQRERARLRAARTSARAHRRYGAA